MAADRERDPGASSAEIGKYLDILAKDPNSRVFAPLAEAYRKAGFLDDAVETALEGLKNHPNYLGGRVALGRAFFEKKRYAEAADEMQKVAKAAPDNIIAHKVLGQIAYSQGDLPAAEKAFKMVLLLDPRDQEAQQFVANLAGGSPPPAPAMPAPPAVTPTVTPTVTPAARPAVTPAARQPSAAQPVPHRAASLPFDEIQEIDDLDLQADDIFSAAKNPPPPAAPPAATSFAEFGDEEPLDIAPDSWLPDRQSPEFPAGPLQDSSLPEPPSVAPPTPVEQPQATGDGMELEVFTRVPWGADSALRTSPPPEPLPPPQRPEPVAAADETESPFEVFGRPQRGGPPQSTRGEQEAFGEIDIESAAYEPAQSETVPATESPFEVFTREPGVSAAPAPEKTERGGNAAPRELDVETTAYTPSDTDALAGAGAGAPLLSLEEELPRVDLSQEVDFDAPAELSPSPADALGEDYEDVVSEGEPPGAAAGRGVFDTETLAAIYVNQGFYGRAAEIYQRLIAQRPADEELRARLESVLALERAEAGIEEPAAAAVAAGGRISSSSPVLPAPVLPAPGEPAAAPGTGPELMISRLQTLLETFKGGRPR